MAEHGELALRVASHRLVGARCIDYDASLTSEGMSEQAILAALNVENETLKGR